MSAEQDLTVMGAFQSSLLKGAIYKCELKCISPSLQCDDLCIDSL